MGGWVGWGGVGWGGEWVGGWVGGWGAMNKMELCVILRWQHATSAPEAIGKHKTNTIQPLFGWASVF